MIDQFLLSVRRYGFDIESIQSCTDLFIFNEPLGEIILWKVKGVTRHDSDSDSSFSSFWVF